MFNVMNWMRVLLTGLVLVAFAPMSSANAADPGPFGSPRSRATERTSSARSDEVVTERPRVGNPEFGILIIIGAVGFVVLVAWLIARVGDDSRSSGDSTI